MSGMLHLDRDSAPAVRDRNVHLRERRAGDRDRIERREQLRRATARTPCECEPNFLGRPRRHAVLQPLELGAKLERKNVRENANELADLDEQTAQLEYRQRDRVGSRPMARDEPCVVPRHAEDRPEHTQPRVADHDANGEPVGSRRAKASRTRRGSRAAAAMRHAPHVDDHAELVGEHVRQHRLHGIERSLDVEVERSVEEIVVDFEKLGAPDSGAGRIEQKMHGAEAVDGELDHVLDRTAFGDVNGERQGLAADCVHIFRRLLDAVFVNIGAYDVGLFARKNSAVARPMPLAAPVMMIVFPAK